MASWVTLKMNNTLSPLNTLPRQNYQTHTDLIFWPLKHISTSILFLSELLGKGMSHNPAQTPLHWPLTKGCVFILNFPKSQQALALPPQCEEEGGSASSATQKSWPLCPSWSSQFWHRCLLQTSGNSGMLQSISGQRGIPAQLSVPMGTFLVLRLCWQGRSTKNLKRSLREGQVRNTGSALTVQLQFGVSQSGTWSKSLLQPLGKGEM